MKKYIFKGCLFLLVVFTAISCSKDLDDERSILGTWIESSPVPERTTLHFGDNNRLTRIDGDGNAEEYIYRIEENTLFLSLVSGQEGSSELFFEQINENRIKIENLYPSIPEAEPTFIIFDRY